jgi:pyrroline-5-carboxylate reductase
VTGEPQVNPIPAAPPSSPAIALIGVGRMGRAVLAGLVGAGWPTQRLLAVEPNPDLAAALGSDFGVSVVSAPDAAAASDVVIVAVKPQQVTDVLAEISPVLRPTTLVISLAAGLPLPLLQSHLPVGTPVIRVMPNTPALVGQGMSVMSPGATCTSEQVALARRVLACLGVVAEVPDSAQDAVTSVSGSGPAYVFYLAEAMIDAGVMLGLARPLATQLAHQTLLGAATMLVTTGETATVLRENVTSPGGTTAAALHALDAAAVKAAIANAMRACRDRSAQLAEQL